MPRRAGAGVFRVAGRCDRPNQRRRSAPFRSRRFPASVRYPSFSPDGNHVAFTWTGPKQDNADVYVQQIGAGSPLRLTTDAGERLQPGVVARRALRSRSCASHATRRDTNYG